MATSETRQVLGSWLHLRVYLVSFVSKQNGKSLAFFNVYAFNMSSWRNSEVGKHSIGYRGGGTNRRQTKDRRPWVHDSTYRPPSIIRLNERKIYSPFSPQLGQSVSSGSGFRKDVVSIVYRNGEPDRRMPCQIQISWVANPFYPSPAGLAVEGMSTRLEVGDLINGEGWRVWRTI